MKAQKDAKTGKWLMQFRYTDWKGETKKTTKRGFNTKREAEEWVRNFLMSQQADFNMNFEEFLKLYYADMAPRIRENTLRTKQYIIDLKILPFFGKKTMNSIKPADIRKWQNELMAKDYSQTYLRTVNNQLTAIFNYATKYYELKTNPCTKAGSMGKNHADEMNFWTKEEFAKFIDAVMDKHRSYVGFKLLFWTGVRIGELLALTVADIDFVGKTLNVSKSYQRIGKKDVVTPPKTPKSNRTIAIPDFLFHAYQSFKPGEVTPEICHEIGVKLAQEMWGDRFQVVVATHLDKSHLHNHFALNSVSFRDGGKYNSCKAATKRLRDVSDKLCREYGLSVIENPGKSPPRSIYLAEKRGEPTNYNIFRQAIDRAIAGAVTKKQFEDILHLQGFEMKLTGKHWTIKIIGDKRATPLFRLGERYTGEAITKRIYESDLNKRRIFYNKPKPTIRTGKLKGSLHQAKKLTG